MKMIRRFVFAIPILVFAHSCAIGTFDYLVGKGEQKTVGYPAVEAEVPFVRCAVVENSTIILGMPEMAILIARENGEIYARYFYHAHEGPREQWN